MSGSAVDCPKCHGLRPRNFREPCPTCGARHDPNFGYMTNDEIQFLYGTCGLLFSGFVFALCLVAIFWYLIKVGH